MATWNYRVIHRREQLPGVIGAEDIYAIHEVHYDDQGRVTGIAENPSPVQAETIKGLNETRMLMAVACSKPILEWDDIAKRTTPAPDAPKETT